MQYTARQYGGPPAHAEGRPLVTRSDVLHDDHAQCVRLEGVEDVRDVAGVTEVVAGAKFDGLAHRAREDAAGAEDEVLDRAGRVRVGEVGRARLGADPVDVT